VWAAPLPHLRDNGFVIALMGMASPLNLRPMIDKALATEGPPLFEGRSRAASAVTDDLGVSDGPSSLILDAMNLRRPMRLIETAIDIHASAARVWSILTDFSAYSAWNPFITAAEGEARPGARLRITIAPPGRRPMTFRPVVLVAVPEQELRWLGRLLLPRLFDGEHAFRLDQQTEACRLYHTERFSGVLLPLFGEGMLEATRRGFEAMNAALRTRAETA
jgi:hypothetical protein